MGETAVALFDFEPQADEQIALRKGKFYTISKKDDNGWWTASEPSAPAKTGIVPSNYLALITEAPSIALAVYSFDGAGQPGTLPFGEGDEIAVLKKGDSGWWIGTLNGNIGTFPANYVEVIEVEAPAQNGFAGGLRRGGGGMAARLAEEEAKKKKELEEMQARISRPATQSAQAANAGGGAGGDPLAKLKANRGGKDAGEAGAGGAANGEATGAAAPASGATNGAAAPSSSAPAVTLSSLARLKKDAPVKGVHARYLQKGSQSEITDLIDASFVEMEEGELNLLDDLSAKIERQRARSLGHEKSKSKAPKKDAIAKVSRSQRVSEVAINRALEPAADKTGAAPRQNARSATPLTVITRERQKQPLAPQLSAAPSQPRAQIIIAAERTATTQNLFSDEKKTAPKKTSAAAFSQASLMDLTKHS